MVMFDLGLNKCSSPFSEENRFHFLSMWYQESKSKMRETLTKHAHSLVVVGWYESMTGAVIPSGNYNYPHLGVCWGVCYTSIYSKLTITKSFSSLTTLPNVSMHPKSVIVTSPQSQIVTSACKTRGDCMVLVEMSWVIGFLATKSGSAIGSMRWAQVYGQLCLNAVTHLCLFFFSPCFQYFFLFFFKIHCSCFSSCIYTLTNCWWVSQSISRRRLPAFLLGNVTIPMWQ